MKELEDWSKRGARMKAPQVFQILDPNKTNSMDDWDLLSVTVDLVKDDYKRALTRQNPLRGWLAQRTAGIIGCDAPPVPNTHGGRVKSDQKWNTPATGLFGASSRVRGKDWAQPCLTMVATTRVINQRLKRERKRLYNGWGTIWRCRRMGHSLRWLTSRWILSER